MPIDPERLKRFRSDLTPAELSQAQQAQTPDTGAVTASSDDVSGGMSLLATKLERVSEKALDKTDEILGLPLPDNANFGAVLRAQTAAANTVIHAQIRVDETRLRPQRVDRLADLLELIRQEEARLLPRYRDGDNNGP